MNESYNILIRKLDAFIRKYYKNQIIKGGIYSITALVVLFLLINFLEYFAWFNSTGRTILFYSYLTISVFILVKFVVIPLLHIFRIGKIISHQQAAQIIGRHFSDVRDKLLNTLQLKELADKSSDNLELIKASIDQKTENLRPIPFNNAIDFRKNQRYLKYALPPLFIFLLLLTTSPGIITRPATRIIHHNKYFEKEAPFRFILLNESLSVIQQNDFTIDLKIEGDVVPSAVFINSDYGQLRMRKKNLTSFDYTFRNLQKDTYFQFEADGFKSQVYHLKVLPRPIILNFETEMNYPLYTGRSTETLENTGDLVVPEGTVIKWKLFTRDTDNLTITYNDSTYQFTPEKANVFSHTQRFTRSTVYSIKAINSILGQNTPDSLVFTISVIPDNYPTITVDEFLDKDFNDRIFFRGIIKDDYGFQKLTFNYEIKKYLEKEPQLFSVPLPLQKATQQQFFHEFDLLDINLQAGDEISYYFEVWDNDGINGSKSARSQKMYFRAPTLEELTEKVENSNQQIKDDIQRSLRDLQILQRQIDEFNRQLLEKNSLNWQDRQKLENLLNLHQSLMQRIENLQQLNEEKLREESRFKEIDEEILRKQEELQKLMDQLLTDEMKKMIEEIQKLLDELDKEKVGEMLKEMKLSSQDLKDQLDRSLELFKQLEFEQKLQETIDKLKELSDRQNKLSEETRTQPETQNDQLKEKQQQLNQDFENIRKDIEDLRKKNQELSNPHDFKETKTQEQTIQNLMQESMEMLNQQKNNKASEKQKDASRKMDELSNALQEMMDSMMMDQLGEDYDTLRQILDNLIRLSFQQEDLMLDYGSTSTNDPRYPDKIKEQFDIKENMTMIADSLRALSKRQMAIQAYVLKELNTIDFNFNQALTAMNDRLTRKAQESQQLAMTSINNLALLLFEAFEQMQQQMMSMQAKGKTSCNSQGRPGGSQQMKSLQQLQQQLNEQLQQLREGQKPGKLDSRHGQQMSEQLARLAAQQAAIRKKMEELRDQLREETGKTDGNLSKIIEDMEKTERDIVNRQITQETIERQKEILTRMLKSEKALMEREEEQRRESREAKNYKRSNPEELLRFTEKKNTEMEFLRTLPPNFTPFYRNKVSEYFIRFD